MRSANSVGKVSDYQMAQKKHKLDIFEVLNHVSKKDTTFLTRCDEEQQKAFQPLVVMRWLSGTKDARQIYFLNELVNPFVFNLQRHKQMLYNLMTTCTNGKSQRYYWNKTISKKSSGFPTTISVIREHYKYNTMQAIDVLPLLTDETIIDIADDLGRQKEDISKIKKELKKRSK